MVFFTGLNRKFVEEKCHFSFEIVYFHSKARKGEKSLFKLRFIISSLPTDTCNFPEVIKYFYM